MLRTIYFLIPTEKTKLFLHTCVAERDEPSRKKGQLIAKSGAHKAPDRYIGELALELPHLVQLEANFDANLNIHGMTILHCRFEAPLLDCLNRLGIEPHSQTVNHANVARVTLIVDDQPKNAGSLSLGVARILGIFRI